MAPAWTPSPVQGAIANELPGMLPQAIEEFPVDLTRSLMVGDKDGDVEAGRRAGVRGLKFTGGDLKTFLEAELK